MIQLELMSLLTAGKQASSQQIEKLYKRKMSYIKGLFTRFSLKCQQSAKKLAILRSELSTFSGKMGKVEDRTNYLQHSIAKPS